MRVVRCAPGIKWCCSLPAKTQKGSTCLLSLQQRPLPTATSDASPYNGHKKRSVQCPMEARVFATIFLVSCFFLSWIYLSLFDPSIRFAMSRRRKSGCSNNTNKKKKTNKQIIDYSLYEPGQFSLQLARPSSARSRGRHSG